MKNVLAVVAVSMALVALGLSWNRSSREVAGGTPAVEVNLDPLIARIAALEKQTADLRRELESDRLEIPARETVSPTPQASVDEDFARRLTQVEKSIAELQIKTFAPSRSNEAAPGLQRASGRDGLTVDQATARARDLAASEVDRVKALGMLRGQRLADGTDARLPVLDDMIQLAQRSADGTTRADVWRQLSHVTDARLKGPLIDALAFDKDDKSREEAAETLADFLPDAQVERALRSASENDASKNVRKQAASSLAGGR